jgi:hypothetical protein
MNINIYASNPALQQFWTMLFVEDFYFKESGGFSYCFILKVCRNMSTYERRKKEKTVFGIEPVSSEMFIEESYL